MITDRIIDGSNDTITAQMETGLSNVLVNVRRRSDGFYLDWDDNTFKNVGWGTQNAAMVEIGITGQYEKLFPLATTTNRTTNDTYIITVSSATSAYSPQIGELKAGDWVNQILALVGKNRKMTNVVHDSNGNLVSATIKGYSSAADASADTSPILTISVTGASVDRFQTSLLEVDA